MTRRFASTLLVLLAACSSTTPTETDSFASSRVLEGIRYDVRTSVMESFPVQIEVAVTLSNPGDTPLSVQFPDGCVVTLRAYQGSTQVWDQRILILCIAAIVDVQLASGETRTFTTRADAAQILGGTLPDGRYRLEAVLNPDGRTLELDAGLVELAVPR